MAKKRFKIIVATISAAGYSGVRKATNTINWKVCVIEDPKWKDVVEQERLNVKEQLESQMPKDLYIRVKVSKVENIFVDTFLDSKYQSESTGKKKIKMTAEL